MSALTDWLEENWDPELTVREWWERLGLAGWASPTLPENAYGKGLSRSEGVRALSELTQFGALGPPGGLGLLLAAPTIATHGTEEQIHSYVRDIVTGKTAWCQLFSEPGAGSDLAGLTTKAVLQNGEYIVNGQKVWTSGGQVADLGMLLARTDPSVPKHQGITYFALDMHQDGVDVRPLREITGHAMFSEVFLSDARTPAETVIGDVNNGWAVANTTLAFERAGLGAGAGGVTGGAALPGTVSGHLDKRAGDFVQQRTARRAGPRFSGSDMMVKLAQGAGKTHDPVIREELAQLHILERIGRLNTERLRAAKAAGKDIPGLPNIAKLLMSEIVRQSREIGMKIAGPKGLLHAIDPSDQKVITDATGDPFLPFITQQFLYSPAPSIYGGTDQIQLNVIGERVLGLPKEPRDDHLKPFNEVPKNA